MDEVANALAVSQTMMEKMQKLEISKVGNLNESSQNENLKIF